MAKVALLVGVEGSSSELNFRAGAGNNVEALKQVLQHPEMGRFAEVKTLMNPDPLALQQAIETLFGDRQRDDLVLLYFCGQGLKNNQGKLYLAASTKREDPSGRLARSSVVPASFIQDVMNSSRAQQQVAILDYWWAETLMGETTTHEVNGSGFNSEEAKQQFAGQHQVVLIASTAVNAVPQSDSTEISAFTYYLIKGLETGAADLDSDGVIAVGEWYEYAQRNLQAAAAEIQSDLYAVKAGQRILLAKAAIADPKLKYRQEVARQLRHGERPGTEGILEVIRDRLGLTPPEAAAIESEVLSQRTQYPTAAKTTPLPPKSRPQAPPTSQDRVAPLKPSQKLPLTSVAAPENAEAALPQPTSTATKVALLIGVSHYGAGFVPLPGTTSDVEGLQRVLEHPEKGGFAVTTLMDPDPLALQQAIETLLGDRRPDDLVLFYFSGHGIKDDRGKLYLTTSATRKTSQGKLFKSTAVPASFLQDVMSDSQSQHQVVILDCWFTGITENWLAEDGPVDIEAQLGGPGRVILTASASTQSIFEQKGAYRSLYSDYLIEGLETGAADLDNDGTVAVHELHEYTRRKVQKSAPAAQPEIYGAQPGQLLLLVKAPLDDVRLRYRKEVERCASYGGLSIVSRSILDVLRDKLQLSPAEATTIEEQVLKPQQEYQKKLQRYAQVFVEAIQQAYPVQPEARSRFRRLQQVLGLRDEDITLIEAQVTRQVKGDQSLARTNISPEAVTPESELKMPDSSSSSNPHPVAPIGLGLKRSLMQILDRQPWINFTHAGNSSPGNFLGLNLANKNLWLFVGAAVTGLLALWGITYGLRQSQGSQQLKTVQILAQQKNYEDCLRQAQALSVSSPAAQRLRQQCEAGANWQNVEDQTFLGSGETVWSVAASPDGRTLASGSGDRTVKVWDLQTRELRHTLSGHEDTVWSVATSPDGRTLASGSGDRTVKVWDLQTGELRYTLTGHEDTVWSVAASPDGRTLASGSGDRTVKVWDLQTGELRYTLTGHEDAARSVAISPDGRTLASGSGDRTVKVWDLQTGELRHSLAGHTERVVSVTISPDGQSLASASNDATVKIWNLQTGELQHTLSEHVDHVNTVAISPSGRTLASGSEDQTARLWDLQTGELKRTLAAGSHIYAIAFTSDNTFVSSNKSGEIKVWRRS